MKDYFRLQLVDGRLLEYGEDWGVNKFPDGQQQFWIEEKFESEIGRLTVSLPRPEHVELLWQVLATIFPKKIRINYLYGARSDKDHAGTRLVTNVAKQMVSTLRALAGKAEIQVLSPHCEGFEPSERQYPMQPELLKCNSEVGWLFPDHSAVERFGHLVPSGTESRICDKVRDQVSGQITHYKVPEFDLPRLLLVDDLCDGGRTFLNIAGDLPDKRMDLYVTHGVFSNNAVPRLLEAFENVYTTNSLPNVIATERLHVLDVWE